MIKDIKYSGYAAQPSDYECPDGQLSAAINLINENGALNIINRPLPVGKLLPGDEVFLHKTLSACNTIIIRRENDKLNLYWLDYDVLTSATEQNPAPAPTLIDSLPSFRDIKALGLVLVVATSRGLRYYRYADDSYAVLGSHPPFVPIEFGLRTNGAVGTTETLQDFKRDFLPNISGGGSHTGRRPTNKESKDALERFSNAVMAQLLSHFEENATSQGRFYQPFFVRYAFRLYDGTFFMHSSPVLMLPCVHPPLISVDVEHVTDGSDGSLCDLKSKVISNYFTLVFRILPYDFQMLDAWKDLISSICIFVSAPIYTYDQSVGLDWPPIISDNRLMTVPDASGSSSFGHRGRHPSETAGNTESQSEDNQLLKGHYEIGDGIFCDHLTDNNFSGYCWNIKANKKIADDIKSAHEFYKIAEIPFDQINSSVELKDLELTTTDLKSLVTRERLTDDSFSHRRLTPSVLFGYNSRMHLADISASLAKPLPLRSVMSLSNKGSARDVKITVWSRTEGKKCCIVTDDYNANQMYTPADNFPRYIFYPEPSAYKMQFSFSPTENYIIDLIPHDFLNGAYYFGGLKANPCPEPQTEPFEDIDCPSEQVLKPSTIYVSEVSNPFIFPASLAVSVGSAKVLALSSAAKALSQGQFGQFPLYAFTDEGVWALEVSSTGSYSARQPITRDVILPDTDPLQMDSSVLFATDRGIMLISGSQTQCITDVINSENPFDVLQLPGISKLHSMLGHNADTCLPTAPFLQFISECGMLYDYVHQRVIVYNPRYTYAYVFSLKSKQWGMIYSTIAAAINSYPEALAVDRNGALLNFSSSQGRETTGLLLTRPLKLDQPDVLKTIDTVIQRGHFRKGHVRSVLYASRDLYNWHLVWSSRDHFLRGFRGTPYKYFRIALLCNLSTDESIFGASLQFTPRQTNQPR